MEPIHKFNNGRGAMLCNGCRTIISTGPRTEELLCDKCKQKEIIIDIMKEDEKLGLYDDIVDVLNRQGKISEGTKPIILDEELRDYYDQMEKEVHQNRSNLNE